MAHEFRQAGDKRFVLQRKGRSLIYNQTNEFSSVEAARAAVKEDLRKSREYKIAGMGVLAFGTLMLAAGVASQFVHDVHGIVNPLYTAPELVKIGVDAEGVAITAVGGGLSAASRQMRKDSALVSAAIDTFVEQSRKTPVQQ